MHQNVHPVTTLRGLMLRAPVSLSLLAPAFVAGVLLVAMAPAAATEQVGVATAAARIQLQSPAFDNGGTIPAEYTCEGAGESPPLRWDHAPDRIERIESIVVMVENLDAGEPGFMHWVVYDLPGDRSGLDAGVAPAPDVPGGGLQGNNGFGETGYRAPCPESGSSERFHFHVYMLDTATGLEAGMTRGQVMARMRESIRGYGDLVGVATRP